MSRCRFSLFNTHKHPIETKSFETKSFDIKPLPIEATVIIDAGLERIDPIPDLTPREAQNDSLTPELKYQIEGEAIFSFPATIQKGKKGSLSISIPPRRESISKYNLSKVALTDPALPDPQREGEIVINFPPKINHGNKGSLSVSILAHRESYSRLPRKNTHAESGTPPTPSTPAAPIHTPSSGHADNPDRGRFAFKPS